MKSFSFRCTEKEKKELEERVDQSLARCEGLKEEVKASENKRREAMEELCSLRTKVTVFL